MWKRTGWVLFTFLAGPWSLANMENPGSCDPQDALYQVLMGGRARFHVKDDVSPVDYAAAVKKATSRLKDPKPLQPADLEPVLQIARWNTDATAEAPARKLFAAYAERQHREAIANIDFTRDPKKASGAGVIFRQYHQPLPKRSDWNDHLGTVNWTVGEDFQDIEGVVKKLHADLPDPIAIALEERLRDEVHFLQKETADFERDRLELRRVYVQHMESVPVDRDNFYRPEKRGGNVLTVITPLFGKGVRFDLQGAYRGVDDLGSIADIRHMSIVSPGMSVVLSSPLRGHYAAERSAATIRKGSAYALMESDQPQAWLITEYRIRPDLDLTDGEKLQYQLIGKESLDPEQVRFVRLSDDKIHPVIRAKVKGDRISLCMDEQCLAVIELPRSHDGLASFQRQTRKLRRDAQKLEQERVPVADQLFISVNQSDFYLYRINKKRGTLNLTLSRKRLTGMQRDDLARLYRKLVRNKVGFDIAPANLLWDKNTKKFQIVDPDLDPARAVPTLDEMKAIFFAKDEDGWKRFQHRLDVLDKPSPR